MRYNVTSEKYSPEEEALDSSVVMNGVED